MLISQHSSKYLRRPSDLGVLLSFPVAMASGRVFYLKKKNQNKEQNKTCVCACMRVRAHTCWQEQGGQRTGSGVHPHLLPYLRHGLSFVVHSYACQDSWPASQRVFLLWGWDFGFLDWVLNQKRPFICHRGHQWGIKWDLNTACSFGNQRDPHSVVLPARTPPHPS